jgi:hypothetical protein
MNKFAYTLMSVLALGFVSSPAKAAFQCDLCHMEYKACRAFAVSEEERVKCLEDQATCVGTWCRYDPGVSADGDRRLVPEKERYIMSSKSFMTEDLVSQG